MTDGKSPYLRYFYGYLAGMSSALLLQPLDNIKMILLMPPKNISFSRNIFKNVLVSAQYLKSQGNSSFYRGLTPNMAKTGVASSVYFAFLRNLQELNKIYNPINGENTIASNFMISAIGRALSSIVTNPLNIVETRYELTGSQRWQGGVISSLKKLYMNQGLSGCMKGTLTNCYKESAFAGVFYAVYSEGKKFEMGNSLTGIISGIIATMSSHPLEIIRIKLQSAHEVIKFQQNTLVKVSIYEQLLQLAKEGQLFKGVTPRLIKKPLANTISFVMFEAFEKTQQTNH